MLHDQEDIAEYINNNFPHAEKIFEVGVGREFSVLRELKKASFSRVIGVDIKATGDEIVMDDITKPDMEIYMGADLIYSIRPGLYPHLQKVARVGASLIIRPVFSDKTKEKGYFRKAKLIKYKKSVFFLFQWNGP